MNLSDVKKLYTEVEHHMKTVNIGCFDGMDKPLFMISDEYPGVWLEHLYDSVFYATLYPGETQYMVNILSLFMERQTADGQLPCYILNGNRRPGSPRVGFAQIQECVSFGSLCVKAYALLGDKTFLRTCFEATQKWVSWLEHNRMTRGEGLIEQFVGFDTGHDNSARGYGFSCEGNFWKDGVPQNAATLPPEDGITPLIAVDMNCNYYGNLMALSYMAQLLGEDDPYAARAKAVKKRLLEVCFDEDTCFFYDVDKQGRKRMVKSSTIFHLFLEKVLDRGEDAALIADIYEKHIHNPHEFWTEYPFPAVAYNDPSTEGHANANCWGYFTQMLIALRCTLWMDDYGFKKDFDYLCEKTVEAWTEHFDTLKFGQELDPKTGIPSPTSEWYSSCMLFYVYAVRRLKLLEK